MARPVPAGRVEGRLLFGERPAANSRLWMHGPDVRREDGANVYVHREATTDAEGRFAFVGVPAGEARVGQVVPMGDEGWCFLEGSSVSLVVRSGRTTQVTLGGLGRPLVGTVVWPKTEERFARTSIRVKIAPVAPPIRGTSDQVDPTWAAFGTWLASPAGRSRVIGKSAGVSLDAAGRFRVEGVPAGAYSIWVFVPADKVIQEPKHAIVLAGKRFEVPHMPDGRGAEPLDLGRIP